jgi:hypothetical protein
LRAPPRHHDRVAREDAPRKSHDQQEGQLRVPTAGPPPLHFRWGNVRPPLNAGQAWADSAHSSRGVRSWGQVAVAAAIVGGLPVRRRSGVGSKAAGVCFGSAMTCNNPGTGFRDRFHNPSTSQRPENQAALGAANALCYTAQLVLDRSFESARRDVHQMGGGLVLDRTLSDAIFSMSNICLGGAAAIGLRQGFDSTTPVLAVDEKEAMQTLVLTIGESLNPWALGIRDPLVEDPFPWERSPV